MTDFLRKLLKLIAPYRIRFIGGILSGVLFAVANAGLMLLLKLVVDMIYPTEGVAGAKDYILKLPTFAQNVVSHLNDWLSHFKSSASESQVVFFILLIPVVMFVRVAAAYFNFYLLNWVAIRAIMDLRTQLFSHLQNLSLSFLHRTTTGELISRISSDTYALSKTLSNSLPVLIREPLTLIVLGGSLIWQQPTLTLISIIVVPICVLPIVIYGRKTRKSSEVIQTNMAELTNIMEEAFSGNRIVKAFNLEEPMLKRFQEKTRVYINHFMRVVRSMELPSVIVEFMAGVGIALIMLYLGVFAKGKTTMGDMMQFIGSIMLMYAPIKALARLHGQLEQGRASSQRIFEMLDEQSSIVEPTNPAPLNASGKEIAFSGIDFSYGDKAILHEVNLTVKPGQLVALVGRTGSGKTTLTNLLLRFYDPQKGKITIGGTNIRETSTHMLRQQMAVVTQDSILFNDTIRNNIALGRPGATEAEIIAAAKTAHAHEFIVEKTAGYDTVIGEKGALLSGGQKQRLAIARAVLRNAPILILDEATGALDTATERAVQSALDELMKGRTTLCIAHRLSTILHADVIVVLEQGRIVEQGPHDELVKRGGAYQKLYELQFRS